MKSVYLFGDGKGEGNATMKELLGGKGANLAEMSSIGIQVPAGFTLTTEVCIHFSKNDQQYPPGLTDQVDDAIKNVESIMGAKFGDSENPLLLSCRSGARESMPGMMDTVLNLGMNDKTVEAISKSSGNARFAWDSYRRLIQMFGDVVLGLKGDESGDSFEHILSGVKKAKGAKQDTDLTAEDLQEVVAQYKKSIKDRTGKDFPQDPMEQVWAAIGAVFSSWDNDRAVVYRRQYSIPHNWGTACNVQAMVFGNLGDDCATGVALTRDGALGNPGLNGDYLINAQGEDVVAGIRVPKRIEHQMDGDMPEGHKELLAIGEKLEKHYKDVQDIEFTIQKGKVWLLQTRNAKRTGFAAVRIAYDLVQEGLISKEEALSKRRIPPDDLNQLLQPIFDTEAKAKANKEGTLLTKGINAGPGAATGKICFSPLEAEAIVQKDPSAKLILVRSETTPEDIRGMRASLGILTELGGTSSHAALVSRQMGKVCVCGAAELAIDYKAKTLSVGDKTLNEGDDISIDGFTGEVFDGTIGTKPSEVLQVLLEKKLKPEDSEVYTRFREILQWTEVHRKLGIRTNADQPDQVKQAIAFGAEGVGLCRTEHMFFDHIDEIREMILAESLEDREKAIAKLLPFQREDFIGIFKALEGRPATIRLLDPPLHEFLPHTKAEQEDLAKKLGVANEFIQRRVEELGEANPMLGHRGCRLGIVYPEITAMQSRAIFEAACTVKKEGLDVHPEVMIPLVGFEAELADQVAIVREQAAKVFEEQSIEVDYLAGTMIEVPRAAICADQIANSAEFFSFGTNDLTQTALGMSRDDYGPFITHYRENDIVPNDPFQTVDQDGVGGLMEIGVQRGRATRDGIKIGICGEHGGDPESVKFCHRIGLDYVSCSPFRIPIARLAAAQATLEENA